MADIWVISDTHFNHEAILTFKDYAGKPPRNGFIDVDYSTNGSSWSTLADGVAFNDGVTLTYDSPSTLSSGSTAYFRFRIDETDPDVVYECATLLNRCSIALQ